MKILITLCILFCATSSFGQDSLELRVMTSICNCLDTTTILTNTSFRRCFENSIKENMTLVLHSIKDTSKGHSYEIGRKFGQVLFDKVSVDMIYNCDIYFHYMDTLRLSSLQNLNRDSIKGLIQQMDKIDHQKKDGNFYTQRGIMNIQVSKMDSALSDFDNAIKLDQNTIQDKFLKAWVLETIKRFDEALTIYKDLTSKTNNIIFKINEAIVRRKKDGL